MTHTALQVSNKIGCLNKITIFDAENMSLFNRVWKVNEKIFKVITSGFLILITDEFSSCLYMSGQVKANLIAITEWFN